MLEMFPTATTSKHSESHIIAYPSLHWHMADRKTSHQTPVTRHTFQMGLQQV